MRPVALYAVLGTLILTTTITRDAHAIAPYTRTTGASCETCHVNYNRLTPLGEAFRRNGHRMPKGWAETSPQETPSDTVDVPLSLGFGGSATAYPKREAAAAQGQPVFDMLSIAGRPSLWFGRAITDTVTAYVSMGTTGLNATLGEARLFFTDLAGPEHVLNLWVGSAPPQLTSYGVHASYFGASLIPSLFEVSMLGGSGPVNGQSGGVELFGIACHRFGYALGVGGTIGGEDSSPTVYGRMAYKVGGLSLDGEAGEFDAEAPWEETALTIDVFGGYNYTRRRMFVLDTLQRYTDNVWFIGANVDGQWKSLNFDIGAYAQRHTYGDGLHVYFAEASYVFDARWVAAVRTDYLKQVGAQEALRLVPGILWTPLAHTTLGLSLQFERPMIRTNTDSLVDYSLPLDFTVTSNAGDRFALQMVTLWLATSI